MNIKTMYEGLVGAFSTYDFIWSVFACLGVLTICLSWLRWFFRKEIRLFKNIKRPVYLFQTGHSAMETEREMLAQNSFFQFDGRVRDIRKNESSVMLLNETGPIVMGYSKDFDKYSGIVGFAKGEKVPLIVVAKPNEISSEHLAIFQAHPYFEMCNTPARLLTTIFSLSSVTPYEKK